MKYFLGVSCEEYSSISSLFFCHADSLRLRETLTMFCDYDSSSECIMPYRGDTDNSGEVIIHKIKDICQKLEEDDVFLFFFAGHGEQKDGDAILLLPDYDDKSNMKDYISIGILRSIFSKSKGFCVSIIDACHSGTDIRPIDLRGDLSRGQERGWAVLASCAGNELSYPYSEKEQGVFSYYLANCIENWNRGEEITLEELKNRICDSMNDWCKKHYKEQHPTINCSIIGRQVIAVRNDKSNRNEIVATEPNLGVVMEESEMKEALVTSNANNISLWNANEGIVISKNADVPEVLDFNIKLQQRTILSLKRNYDAEDYESVSEIIWEKAICILRTRILGMGVEFVGEMVGLDNEAYVRELPAFEVINLAAELGFIDATGKMRLSQANELVQHYRNNDITEEMPRNEIETIIRACVQYILGYDDTTVSFEFSEFRNNLKRETFSTARLEVLNQSPYFYKKTTLRTLFNLLNSTEGAEYEIVATNFVSIIESIWNSLSSDDRYSVGINFSKYVNQGDIIHVNTYKYALEKVHGFDYVPENLRSISFIQAAKKLKYVHYSLNNFYNEPEAARALERLGTIIPRPAIKESISACLICLTGNAYGRSEAAVDVLINILKKLDRNAWIYYFDECFAYDEDYLINIANGDNRTLRWCKIVEDFKLDTLNLRNGKMQEMLENAKKQDKANVKSYVISLLKKINKY